MLTQPSTNSRTQAKPQKQVQCSARLLVSEIQVAITQRPLRVCGASPRSTSEKLTKSNVAPCRMSIEIPIKGRGLIHHESTLTYGSLRLQPWANSNTTPSSEIPETLKVQGLGFRVQGLGEDQLHSLQHVAGHCSEKVGLLSSRIQVEGLQILEAWYWVYICIYIYMYIHVNLCISPASTPFSIFPFGSPL